MNMLEMKLLGKIKIQLTQKYLTSVKRYTSLTGHSCWNWLTAPTNSIGAPKKNMIFFDCYTFTLEGSRKGAFDNLVFFYVKVIKTWGTKVNLNCNGNNIVVQSIYLHLFLSVSYHNEHSIRGKEVVQPEPLANMWSHILILWTDHNRKIHLYLNSINNPKEKLSI